MKSVREKAMDLLARREHSRYELVQKLIQRSYEKSEIAAALDTLASEGLQSDARFAAEYVRMRINRGYGPVRIAQELQARGVNAEVSEPYLRLELSEWGVYALQALKKKKGDELQQRRFLQYRGFSHEHIQFAMRAQDEN